MCVRCSRCNIHLTKGKGLRSCLVGNSPGERPPSRLFKGEHQHTKPKCFCCWQLHFYLLMLQTCFLGGKYGEKCFIILGQSTGCPHILCESFQQIFWWKRDVTKCARDAPWKEDKYVTRLLNIPTTIYAQSSPFVSFALPCVGSACKHGWYFLISHNMPHSYSFDYQSLFVAIF